MANERNETPRNTIEETRTRVQRNSEDRVVLVRVSMSIGTWKLETGSWSLSFRCYTRREWHVTRYLKNCFANAESKDHESQLTVTSLKMTLRRMREKNFESWNAHTPLVRFPLVIVISRCFTRNGIKLKIKKKKGKVKKR